MLTKTTIFIYKVSFLISPQEGKQTGFVRARTNLGTSFGAMRRVMVTRAQAWCEI
ncbi:hypothetical protein Hanom_Chr01g00061721 [Helianthus anomalus]